MKKTPQGYFSKIAHILSAALAAQSAQRQQKYKINFSFLSTYILGIYTFEFAVCEENYIYSYSVKLPFSYLPPFNVSIMC